MLDLLFCENIEDINKDRNKLVCSIRSTIGYLKGREDNRGALASVLYVLIIRTINALKIIAFSFVFAFWGLFALASYKTVLSIAGAVILTGIHTGIWCYYNWIAWSNINFWLATVVVMMIGGWLGRCIEHRTDFIFTAWPTIKFLEHLPKEALVKA